MWLELQKIWCHRKRNIQYYCFNNFKNINCSAYSEKTLKFKEISEFERRRNKGLLEADISFRINIHSQQSCRDTRAVPTTICSKERFLRAISLRDRFPPSRSMTYERLITPGQSFSLWSVYRRIFWHSIIDRVSSCYWP